MPMTETLNGVVGIPRIPYSVITIPLDDARDNVLVASGLSSDFLAVIDMVNPSMVAVTVRLNYPNAAPIPLEKGRTITCPPEFLKRRYSQAGLTPLPPIDRLYLTHDASPGGYIQLAVGGDASFEVGTAGTVEVIGISTMISLLTTLITTTSAELQRAITGVDLSAPLASTATPLGAGETWASGWFVIDRYATIVATVVSDRACRIWFEQSWDATNVDAAEWGDYPDPSGALGSGDGYHTQVVAPYGRVRVVNTSGSAQSLLRVRAGGRAI